MKDFIIRFRKNSWNYDAKFGVEIIPHVYRLGLIYLIITAVFSALQLIVQLGELRSLSHIFSAAVFLIPGLVVMFFKYAIAAVIWRAACEFVETCWQAQ